MRLALKINGEGVSRCRGFVRSAGDGKIATVKGRFEVLLTTVKEGQSGKIEIKKQPRGCDNTGECVDAPTPWKEGKSQHRSHLRSSRTGES